MLEGKTEALRHPSPEGGLDTIGFGHKLTLAEVRAGKVYDIYLSDLDIDAAHRILEKDVRRHESLVRLNGYRNGYTYDNLDEVRAEMLVEMNFNVGDVYRKFPSFTKAVYANDRDGMLAEYERSYLRSDGKRVLLEKRNRMFKETFLDNV